jgi:hypothetical protein
MTDEPVGYLGGEEGDAYGDPYGDAAVDPYGDPAADAYADPYGGGDDGEVVGLLGGAQAEEELPALPGAEGGDYSASDFMDSNEGAYADPYADPYADQADDPYALPPSESQDDYEGYDAGAMAEDDPSYFDSMGHDDGYGQDIETQSAEEYTEYDDDSPKTISQQDAESIIRRITTKRILPPDQEKKISPRQLTPTGGGLRIWPILVVGLLLAAGGVLTFKEDIARAIPELAGILGVELETEKAPEEIDVEDPDAKAKRLMLEKVLKSELKALDVEASELSATGGSKAAGPGPAGTDGAAPGSGS